MAVNKQSKKQARRQFSVDPIDLSRLSPPFRGKQQQSQTVTRFMIFSLGYLPRLEISPDSLLKGKRQAARIDDE